jgi:MoxR-like ATPase
VIQLKLEDIRKIWESDNYIDIAFKEYLKFRNSDIYNEKYKFDILNELNNQLQNIRITPDNVVSIIEMLRDKNPLSGSFVNWRDLDNLLKIAKEEPMKVSKVINELYDESIDLLKRIDDFISSISENNFNYSPGTPLIGYLLASYDLTKYPLYKDETWTNFLHDFGIEEKFGSKAEKYVMYYQVCNMLKNFFEEKGFLHNSNILEIQDFVYCVFSRVYKDLAFKISIKYLKQKAEFINALMNDENFIDYLNKLDKEYVKKLFEKYSESEKINKIRFLIAEKLLNGNITIEDLESFKEEVTSSEEKDILKPWNNFRILFPFYYEKYKEKSKIELEKLVKLVFENFRKDLERKNDLEYHFVDFYGPQNFGTNVCWFALYPKKNQTHQKSAQLGLAIYPNFIDFGLWFGSEVVRKLSYDSDIEKLENVELLNLEDVIKKFKEDYKDFIKISEEFYQKFIKVPHSPEPSGDKGVNLLNWNKPLEIKSLLFEEKEILLSQISTSLASGKHIILIGPPGTGKSKLAKEICESFGVEYEFVTAVSDWSTFDTIGGYRPNVDGTLYFDEGIFLKALKSKNNKKLKWLIIDEINRADIDKSFGPLFSVLAGDKVTLSFKTNSGKNIVIMNENEEQQEIEDENVYVLPKDFRIIGTMNTYDKTSLYELSYAFMRRFAFIYVGIPKNINTSLVESFLNKWGIEDKSINEINLKEGLTEVWNIINKYRQVGPAIIKDIANFVSLNGDYTSAIILYVFPQFEGVPENKIRQFVEELKKSTIKDFSKNEEVLKNFIGDFFGISLE